MTISPTIDVRRAADRFATRLDWLDSHHSFSFSRHYDPANTHHGLLLVNNDDVVRAGTGFSTHPHQDMEIVTWVLDGELEHKDSVGHRGVLYPGLAQRMSAGRGIWHSEMNPRGDADGAGRGRAPASARSRGWGPGGEDNDVHFVQMWVLPDTERVDPGYEQLDINGELARGGLVPIASGRGHDAAISIRQRDAVLWGGRLAPGETVAVPDAHLAHVFVARGSAVFGGGIDALEAGDAVRLTAAGTPALTAGPDGAEVLIWEMA
ncbi:MAG TPA: pirin family protein [Acidimicrobiales bacterium]|jgi:redox-sensitive bicupin YhaK (pirin superfamily)|nr:pirin family protein [Acidimicrobiales bacterium]